MSAPFSAMEPGRRARLVVGATAATFAIAAVLWAVAGPMRANGSDIVPFEVAGTPAEADRIIDGWGAEGVRAARLQTVFDDGFLVAYGVALASGCALVVGRATSPFVRRVGAWVGTGALVASGFDAIENAALLAELSGHRGVLPRLAQVCASVKFGLVGLALPYALGGLAVTEVQRRRRT